MEDQTWDALLDTGSAVNLVQPRVIPPGHSTLPDPLLLTCVHGDAHEVSAVCLGVKSNRGQWNIRAGVVAELPIPVVLGRNFLGYENFDVLDIN
ncbi:hypothetical protein JZ751_004379 [Albula glossodonta]|uniref:Uncharacterized protein n=1 Tax=Albula glossodonta TaxID=121402 RepID=A0A8T2N6K1_9TELE|nr:hypothetical protein JZ751_004379 [Albula glossodonta]